MSFIIRQPHKLHIFHFWVKVDINHLRAHSIVMMLPRFHNSSSCRKGISLFICFSIIRNLIRSVNSRTPKYGAVDFRLKIQEPCSLQIPLHLSHCPCGGCGTARYTWSLVTCVTNILSKANYSFVSIISRLSI